MEFRRVLFRSLLVDGTFHRKEMNELVLGGDIRSYGSEGNAGGTLTIAASGRPITIGDAVLGGGEDLMAGEALPMDLQLLEDIILKAGMEMPIDFLSTIDTLYAGDINPKRTEERRVGKERDRTVRT